MASDASKQFSQLSQIFNRVVDELKGTTPLIEDVVARAGKLQRHFDATASTLVGFLEAVQKVADHAGAASSYGGASDLGTCMTKIALRHRTIAAHYTSLSSTIGEDVCKNLVSRMELRRKTLAAVEKEHEKDFRKWKVDLKKRNENNLKLATKGKKKGERTIQDKLEESVTDSVELYEDFQVFEQDSLRKVLLEERKHYCTILSSLAPVMAAEVSVLDEVYHLQELSAHCSSLADSYETLPAHSEQAVSNLQLDLGRLFKQAPCHSPAIQQARKANQLKRNSMMSLTSDGFSMDNMSLASSLNPTIASDELSAAAISDGTEYSSPSLNAVRLDPDGCPGQHSPEPMYADIDTMQGMHTPSTPRAHPVPVTTAVSSGDSRSSGGSSTDLHSNTSRTSLGVINNQPINPFGKPTAEYESTKPPEQKVMTLTRTTAKESLQMLAKVIPPVAPKPPSKISPPDPGSIYAEADCGPGAGDNEWPAIPGIDDLPSPPPFDDLPTDVDLTPVRTVPPPVSTKPPRQDRTSSLSSNRMSQSLDTLYSETRQALSKRSDEPSDLDDIGEMFPPPPPPEECLYDEVQELMPPPAMPSSVSMMSDIAGSHRHTLPAFSAVNNQDTVRARSGSTGMTSLQGNRLPAQAHGRPRSTSRPLEKSHTISMDV